MMSLIIVGCGTVGYSVLSAFLRAPLAQNLSRVALIDRGIVRPHNAITCPGYADFHGLPKPEALRAACSKKLPKGLDVDLYFQNVETVDWLPLLKRVSPPGGQDEGRVLVVIGLDDWQSRLCVVEALRLSEADSPARIAAIQVGLDRGEAQVSIFGNLWCDPCPACGLSTLPQSEPCVVRAGEGLVRGNLQAEARAAAAEVIHFASFASVIEQRLSINTKTNLVAVGNGGQFVHYRHPRRHVAGCLGPHASETPISPAQLLSGISEERVIHA